MERFRSNRVRVYFWRFTLKYPFRQEDFHACESFWRAIQITDFWNNLLALDNLRHRSGAIQAICSSQCVKAHTRNYRDNVLGIQSQKRYIDNSNVTPEQAFVTEPLELELAPFGT